MEAAVGRVLVLAAAVRAHWEAGHRRVRPVVWDREHNREPGTTARAVDEGVAVPAVGLVEKLAQAFVAAGDVRRDQRRGACRSAQNDLELALPARPEPLDAQAFQARQLGSLFAEQHSEGVERGRGSLRLDHDPIAVVQHEAAEPLPMCKSVHERPEADPLDDALDPESAALPCDHRAQRLADDASSQPQFSSRRIRETPDVGLARCCEPRREEVSLAGFTTSVIAPAALDTLVDALRTHGYRVLGPTTREGAIVYDELQSAAELSIGWTSDRRGASMRGTS